MARFFLGMDLQRVRWDLCELFNGCHAVHLHPCGQCFAQCGRHGQRKWQLRFRHISHGDSYRQQRLHIHWLERLFSLLQSKLMHIHDASIGGEFDGQLHCESASDMQRLHD